jgi:hypothetical protein
MHHAMKGYKGRVGKSRVSTSRPTSRSGHLNPGRKRTHTRCTRAGLDVNKTRESDLGRPTSKGTGLTSRTRINIKLAVKFWCRLQIPNLIQIRREDLQKLNQDGRTDTNPPPLRVHCVRDVRIALGNFKLINDHVT